MTGAYYPEISAAGVQCRAVAAAIGDLAQLSILTTAVDGSLPSTDTIDGRPIARVAVDVTRRASKALASLDVARHLLHASSTYDIIHVHGFSQKNVPVSIFAGLARKPLVLTLHTAGQDEPGAVKRHGALASWSFASADLTLAVSPSLLDCWRTAGLDADRIRLVPNGVDTHRFRPADDHEKAALRREIGWPAQDPVVLFVGFFSRDKRPDLLFRAWCRGDGPRSRLAFVGATRSGYYEIDESIAQQIASEAAAAGRADDVLFAEPAKEIDRYFRAADVFALPSIREAHPLALLEAMACGLPCIATRLAGATDAIITDGDQGILVPPDDEGALARAITAVLQDPAAGRAIGARARQRIVDRYDIQRTAGQWLDAYHTVLAGKR